MSSRNRLQYITIYLCESYVKWSINPFWTGTCSPTFGEDSYMTHAILDLLTYSWILMIRLLCCQIIIRLVFKKESLVFAMSRFTREKHTLSSYPTWGWHWLCILETTRRSQTQQWISLISILIWSSLFYLSFQDFRDKLHLNCFCFCSWFWTGYTVGGQKCGTPHVLYGCIHRRRILGCKICPWNRIHSIQMCFVLLSVAKVKTFRPPRWFCQLGYPWFLDFRDLSWWSPSWPGDIQRCTWVIWVHRDSQLYYQAFLRQHV